MEDASQSMLRLTRGQFLGHAISGLATRQIVFSEIRYDPHAYLRPHEHESAYLSFVLRGHYVEKAGTRTWSCGINTLREALTRRSASSYRVHAY